MEIPARPPATHWCAAAACLLLSAVTLALAACAGGAGTGLLPPSLDPEEVSLPVPVAAATSAMPGTSGVKVFLKDGTGVFVLASHLAAVPSPAQVSNNVDIRHEGGNFVVDFSGFSWRDEVETAVLSSCTSVDDCRQSERITSLTGSTVDTSGPARGVLA